MAPLEKIVLRYFLALLLISVGAALVLRGQGLLPVVPEGGGYLMGVVARSFENRYPLGLLAGLVCVPLHALCLGFFVPDPALADAYDQFGSWLQVLFTSLGFLGTVVGVSLAVAGLPQAMDANNPGPLIEGLSTAFDTTFLGLTAAVLTMISRQSIRAWRG